MRLPHIILGKNAKTEPNARKDEKWSKSIPRHFCRRRRHVVQSLVFVERLSMGITIKLLISGMVQHAILFHCCPLNHHLTWHHVLQRTVVCFDSIARPNY